jgi:hypothetical protein
MTMAAKRMTILDEDGVFESSDERTRAQANLSMKPPGSSTRNHAKRLFRNHSGKRAI